MFPVYLQREEDQDPPEEPTAFVVGKNGAFVYKRALAFRAMVRTTEVSTLAEVKEVAEYTLPPIPPHLVMQIIAFFRDVYTRYHTEAILVISYNPARETFRLDAPDQTVGGANLRYTMPERAVEGFTFVGTVHSHADFSAHHSGVDQHDEKAFDGVHLTIGDVAHSLVDIVASLSISGSRFKLSPERVLGGVAKVTRQVVKKETMWIRVMDGVIGFVRPRKYRRRRSSDRDQYVRVERPYYSSRSGYEVTIEPGTRDEDCLPDPEWITKVHATTYAPTNGRVYDGGSYVQSAPAIIPSHAAAQPLLLQPTTGHYDDSDGDYGSFMIDARGGGESPPVRVMDNIITRYAAQGGDTGGVLIRPVFRAADAVPLDPGSDSRDDRVNERRGNPGITSGSLDKPDEPVVRRLEDDGDGTGE